MSESTTQMKFGILFTSQPNLELEQYPYREVHDRVTREILAADELGYDTAWIAEHHASRSYGILPDPMAYISYLATLTKNISFGTAVMTLPLQNVLRLVETSSFVDILTEGRLILGVGSGYRKYEFDAYNVDFEARRDIQVEALELLMRMFHERQVDHDGQYFSYHVSGDYEIYPHSVQEPHPPLYMAAATERSIGLGAEYGLGLLLSTLTSFEELAGQCAFYRDEAAKTADPYNRNPGFLDIDIARYVYVADSDAEARRLSEEGILRHFEGFTTGQTSGYLGTVSPRGRNIESELTYDKLNRETILHGSPETVIEKIQELKDRTGLTSLMLHFPPYYGPERTQDAIRMFAETVMPKIR